MISVNWKAFSSRWNAGEIAATTATMKLEHKGSFCESIAEVEERMKYVQEV